MKEADFLDAMTKKGWVILSEAVPRDLVNLMREDLDTALQVCRRIQVENGVADDTAGTVHHLPAIRQCLSFLEFLESNPAHPYLERWMGGKYVLQSFGGNFNYPENSYASQIHRDIRRGQKENLVVNVLVMLDDFTVENGATWMMEHSRDMNERPDRTLFYLCAKQVTAPAGSILIFDSNLWHAAGQNRTDKVRRSVTPMFARPYLKAGFDYCRAIGPDVARMSPRLQQVLGYKARIPASLSEWYRKPDERFYQGDQG